MAEVKYLKLGEKAESFFDPSTSLKLSKGKVVRMTQEMKISNRVKKALKGGHIEYATEEDFDKTVMDLDVQADDVNQEEEVVYTESNLKGKGKEALINILLNLSGDEEERTEKELSALTKAEIIEEILDLQEEEED